MRRLRRWLTVACYAGCIAALTACGDDDSSGTDAGETMLDGSMRDGGGDASMPDPCAGRALCDSEGTSCDGDTLVTCAEDADGCLVETRTGCAAGGEVCEEDGDDAACVDPCAAIDESDRCTTDGARSCDEDTLEVCAANADGCLVLTETECDEAPGGVCNPSGGTSGDMPVCEVPPDPCAGVAEADRCDTAGTSCNDDELVTCAPNASGCLVRSAVDCTTRTDGTCEDSDGTASCSAPDACASVTECAAEGASCEGPELVRCAPDAFGCLVETRTDCTDVAFGFCDADASPAAQCSTAATDPCMGVTQCGTETTRVCSDSDTISTCAPNAFGCFVETATECAPSVCDASGETPICVDPCSLVDTCSAAAQCEGNELVTCAPDANGCLVETTRTTCDSSCGLSGGAPACVDALCPTVEPLILDCESGTVMGNTAGGSTVFAGASNACTSSSYSGPERVYRFRNPSGPVDVRIVSTRLGTSGDFDLFAIGGNGTATCTSESLTCSDSSTGTSATETIDFFSAPGDTTYVVYDIYSGTTTTEYTLAITCTPVVCGDGDIGNGEQCDDGNTDADDGCSSTCQRESGFDCNTAEPTVCTRIVCGDGVIGTGETCDDGDLDDLDGCSATCQVEEGWRCSGTTSTCIELASNSACAGATAIAPTGALPETVSVTGEDANLGGARPTGSSCGTGIDRALHYAVTIPARSWVEVVATRGTATDLVLAARESCEATACLLSSDTPEQIRLENLTASPVTRIVSVFAYNAAGSGTYDVQFRYSPFAANATCGSATPISGDDVVTDESIALGGPRPTGSGCGTTGSNALYYALELEPNEAVDIRVTPDATGLGLALVTQDACGGACTSRTTGESLVGRVSNTTGATITRIVAVVGGTTGGFQIELDYSIVAPNAACSTGTVVSGDRTILAEDLSEGGTAPTGTSCGSSAGMQALYYQVSVPAMSAVDVAVTPDASSTPDVVLLVQDSCGAASCSQRNDGDPERARLRNVTSSPVTQIVAIHARTAADAGQYDIAFDQSALAANAACGTATAIAPGEGATGENLAFGGPKPAGTGCGTGGDNALYYAVTIAPYTELTVTATPVSGAITMVGLDSCAATACSQLDSSAPREVRFTNSTAAPITRIVAVYNSSATTSPTFDLSTSQRAFVCGDGRVEGVEQCDDGGPADGNGCSSTCTFEPGFVCTGAPSTCRAAADNAFCAGAIEITGTDAVTDENAALGGPRPQGTGCGTSTTAANERALFYSVQIPPQTRVEVSALGTMDIVLLTADSCAAAACTSRLDAQTTSGPEVATLRNDSPTETVTRIVAVHPFSATTGSWDVSFTYHPYVCGDGRIEGAETCDDGDSDAGDGCSASCTVESGFACVGAPSVCVSGAPDNAYCAGAVAITGDDLLTGESTAVGGPITGTSCGSGGNRAMYYAVTAQPGELVAVQTANITGDIQLFVAASCTATSCLSSTNAAPEGYGFTNTTDAPITRIIGVRSASATTPATYDIAFTYLNATFTSITAACVDTSAGVSVPGATGDSAISSAATLPFAFQLLGTPVTHWAASTNGFVQLATSASTTSDSATSNTALPNSSTPNGVVAAFWDDLVVSSPGSVRTLVTGTAGSRRFVIEWNQVEIWNQTGRISFQAHLVEGTNAIEVHYCSSTGTGARFTGSGATAGLESVTGSIGVTFGYDTEGRMVPGSGYRYVP